ncbi:putative B3 domain-containing protein At3g24850 [Malania oleifera]|uniref:putative B3 domain-containing protein At3g24850 n=1 Tax=Malania oleifera TaxID=397392 RepID=UPI0025ADD7B6|nr:putative B3 domain-containing protein At3g24850 [Malania oleifera]
MEEEKELRPLSKEDFDGLRIHEPWEQLLLVAAVASSLHSTECNSSNHDLHHFDGLRIPDEPWEQLSLVAAVASSLHSTESAEMSHRLRNGIIQIGGIDILPVIRKKLSSTDVSSNHNRLSIPLNQVMSEFLTPEEKNFYLSQRNASGKKLVGMEVPLMVDHPRAQDLDVFSGIRLKKWDMKKEKGKTSSCYVLVSKWNDVVAKTKLENNKDIQLWSFRRKTQLCFALRA